MSHQPREDIGAHNYASEHLLVNFYFSVSSDEFKENGINMIYWIL